MGTDAKLADMVESDATMWFSRKLSVLIEHWPGSKSELARRVGVSPQLLHQYMTGSMPKPLTLVGLARELDASLEWLLDEGDHSLQPVRIRGNGAQQLSDDELMEEVTRRYLISYRELLEKMEQARKACTFDAAVELLHDPDAALSKPEIARAISLITDVDRLLDTLRHFQPDEWLMAHPWIHKIPTVMYTFETADELREQWNAGREMQEDVDVFVSFSRGQNFYRDQKIGEQLRLEKLAKLVTCYTGDAFSGGAPKPIIDDLIHKGLLTKKGSLPKRNREEDTNKS